MTRETAYIGSFGIAHPRACDMEPSNIIRIDPGKGCMKDRSECDVQGTSLHKGSTSVNSDKTDISAAEERKRTGRYLAVCLTLVMVFIACYHILMKQMPVLVGLLAPAIIMMLYLIWLLYFAKKRKRTETEIALV